MKTKTKVKKQYALKITRNTAERTVNVHPVTLAPPDATPYRLKYPRPYYAESLQLFPTKKEAEAAREAELIAAEFAMKSDAELSAILRADMERLANFGISGSGLCRVSGVKRSALASYLNCGNPPNPRIAAKFHIITENFARVAESAARILPEAGGCGNPRKGRGGQSDIWMTQKRFSPPRKTD